ncbi:MAG: HAD-IA family hydrolase [Hahellaceae bacterium]|nr:HAD-IA family hydrolase [Hahellaceae bacterium]
MSGLTRPDAVFFDLDGTLIDTAPDFFRVMNQLRTEEGRERLRFDTVRQWVSNGSKALIRMGFDLEETHPDFERLRQRLLDLYLAGVAEESVLFPGFDRLLDALDAAGIPWGIVTNKPRRFSVPLLTQMGLQPRLSSLVCADDLPRTKPHPDPLLRAAEESGVPPERSWYVGDHERDIQAGRAAGMRTIAAGYGYLEPDTVLHHWQADHSIQTADELYQLIFR